jgi:CheY-like chemotaxis protein
MRRRSHRRGYYEWEEHMAEERLLIVEDERIVAEDLQELLKRLNYQVVGIASSGEEAIQKAEETRPDLVLMDIRLNGELDGIQAAETIWTHYNVPVTYLTAYADDSTLERAKATMPFGYILKPFEERDLRTTIEIALYKHGMESTLKNMGGWHASALESLGDAVITTNPQGKITFMNPAAESLTGWSLRKAYGTSFEETFQIPPETAQGSLTAKDGEKIRVEVRVNPLKDEEGRQIGNVTLLHATQPRKTAQTTV